MGAQFSPSSFLRCLQSLLTFIFVSICLLLLSILTYFTLRKHLIPVSHLIIPISFGFPSHFHPNNEPTSYLVSYTNLSDPMYDHLPLDISQYSYRVELICYSPRSYTNRQLGSFFAQLLLYSTSNELILEHSRLILFPYQSDIVRLVRTIMFLPLSIFHIDYDRWYLKQILIERLRNSDQSKHFIEMIQLNIIPSSFQLDQCSLHFHIRDLTGLVYSFVNYPILTSCLSICVLLSIYLTFYLIITGLTMLNQMTKKEYIK